MSIPNDLRYTKSHEWVKLGNDGIATVGITQHAQELLGDMVFVETPVVGRKLKQGEECAVGGARANCGEVAVCLCAAVL